MLLGDKPLELPPELRQAYAWLLLSEVALKREKVGSTGSKSVLAQCASTELGDEDDNFYRIDIDR